MFAPTLPIKFIVNIPAMVLSLTQKIFADVGMKMLGVACVSHFAELDFCENALTILLMKSHRKELDVFGLQTYL